MDQWAQSFKIIHGKTPTKADRTHLFEPPVRSNDDQENIKVEFKGSELKPSKRTPSLRKPNPRIQKILRKPQQSQTSFESPVKEPPQMDNLLRTPSPKKLMRPTEACSNLHLLLKEDDDQFESDKEEKPVKVFEDECPEESLKLKDKKPGGQRKKADASGFGPNYVKANLKRKRYVSKAGNAKKFKRFKRTK